MARRRISPAQLRSQLRQAQNKQRQAITKFNQAVRRYNQGVKTAVNRYNQEVRAHNARVRAHRQRVRQELARLNSRSSSTRYTTFRVSVQTVHDAYVRYEAQVGAEPEDARHAAILDLAEREDANSLAVMNALLDEERDTDEDSEALRETQIADELRMISGDLDARWRGAVYALSPKNPDAARHFCTSARAVFVQMLELQAPDREVLSAMPSCETTQAGQPTRRSKIRYVLSKKGLAVESLEDFVQRDVENVLELFGVFNSGTHGPAGRYDLRKLTAIKTRVEEGLLFLSSIVA